MPGCPKTYKDERSVTRHINTEHENLRFECKVCGDKVTTEKILADHIKRTHENLRPFNCTVPGCKSKPFATEKDLREHNRGVHGVRVECTLCGQTFARKKHLTGHMVRKHPEDKLKCEVPGCRSKAFATESELTEHTKRIHEKYNCTVPGCEGKFATKLDFDKHNRDEHNVKVKCTVCGQMFSFTSLTRHMAKKHPEGG